MIASRIHGFYRSPKEVTDVVRICEATLKKRLVEFEATPASQLTSQELEFVELEDECDPPAFTRSQLKKSEELVKKKKFQKKKLNPFEIS